MIDLGKEHKPCRYGHDSPRSNNGGCMECKRICRAGSFDEYSQTRYEKIGNKRQLMKEAVAGGINGDIRREIENRRLDKELEDLLNA